MLRAAMIMPALLLQRCSSGMKTSEMKRSLERRIDMWKNVLIKELHKDGEALQLRAAEPRGKDTDNMAHCFANLVFQGRIKDALRLLSNKPSGGSLSPEMVLDDSRTVFDKCAGSILK